MAAIVDDGEPNWLHPCKPDLVPWLVAFAFILFTVAGAVALTVIDDRITYPYELISTPSLQITLQQPFSKYLFWDISANAVMFAYFVVFYVSEDRKSGVLRNLPQEKTNRIFIIYILSLILLFLATLFSLLYSFQIINWILPQLASLSVFAGLVTWGDSIIMRFEPRKKQRIQYELFVYFVDAPMVIGFAVIFVVGLYSGDRNLAIFTSGAIAFQVLAFNFVFAFLNRFPIKLTRGKTALLLRQDGEISESYEEFMMGWRNYWLHGRSLEMPSVTPQDVAVNPDI